MQRQQCLLPSIPGQMQDSGSGAKQLLCFLVTMSEVSLQPMKRTEDISINSPKQV